MSASGLDAVLARPDVWRGRRADWSECHASGFDTLDAALGGGWPTGLLIECLGECGPGADMTLFLPAVKRLQAGGRVILVDPPLWPYAPAIMQAGIDLSCLLLLRPASQADWLWASVQCLEDSACQAVLLWRDDPGQRALRRLQLAAEGGHGLAVLFRSPDAGRQASPAPLRLAVRPRPEGGLSAELLKCRGRPPCVVDLPDAGPA